jgi:hypothetical protein
MENRLLFGTGAFYHWINFLRCLYEKLGVVYNNFDRSVGMGSCLFFLENYQLRIDNDIDRLIIDRIERIHTESNCCRILEIRLT